MWGMNSENPPLRQLSALDQLLDQADRALRTTLARPAQRPDSPAHAVPQTCLSDTEKDHSAGLMRINHAGEVCAQALYDGQALVARDPQIAQHLRHAAEEETRHLAWCDARLTELGSKPSLLGPLWYTGSFTLGVTAGLAGDQWSLGFVEETERQVEAHLADHLQHLPDNDKRSRAIVSQMMIDEARHGQQARDAGANTLPDWIRSAMSATAKVMKFVAYRL